MPVKFSKIILVIVISIFLFGAKLPSVLAVSDLRGRILLQVEDKGQAWYVNPVNSQRYYLGRPIDAFNLIRSLGLGVSNADLASFQKNSPRRLAGRILLQVQSQGQAYYLNPLDLKLYYLGRPIDAFNLMRTQGLGISNKDLLSISIFSQATTIPSVTIPNVSLGTTSLFTFKYQSNSYEIDQVFAKSWYETYRTSPKVFTYSSATEPPNLRDAFYNLFLQTKPGDSSLTDLAAKLKAIATANNWDDNQLAELTLSFVQAIAYDNEKLINSNNRNIDPYYPYETLYLKRGVCSDKTFLAVALLRKLGYGAAILDFPDLNHSAVGIACPLADSINNSGYCYGETTNYFPLGVIPQTINSGQAQTVVEEFSNLFDSANLGTIEIYQKTNGKIYQGLSVTRAKIAAIKTAKEDINSQQTSMKIEETSLRTQESNLKNLKAEVDAYYNNGQISQYNASIPAYNDLVKQYNIVLAEYQIKVAEYNQMVIDFNRLVKEFYQK